MDYKWFQIFNIEEFDALNLFSVTYDVVLEGFGQKSLLVTKSKSYNILCDDVFLPLNLNDRNPFSMDGYAIYSDELGDVYLGVLDAD